MNQQQNAPQRHPLTQPHTSQRQQTTRTPVNPQPQTRHPIKPASTHSHSPHPQNPANQKTGPTNRVTTAANACHQGVTDANNIAVTPAEAPLTANVGVTLANSKCNATDHCHTNASGKFAMSFNAATHAEPLPSISVFALDPIFNGGQADTKTAVPTPAQADPTVTDVTLATVRRHTVTHEPPAEAAHQAKNLPAINTFPDAKTAAPTPAQAGLNVTDVTLATVRRHTVTDEPPVEVAYQAASVLPNNTPSDTRTAVQTPSQADLTVTDVTLATGRRHTVTHEPPAEAAHQAKNLPAINTFPDAKTAAPTPAQAGLSVTDVTLATGRRHTVTDEPPAEAAHQAKNLSATNTFSDAKTAALPPAQASLTVTDVTLATGRRHTVTVELPLETAMQNPIAVSPTLPLASADETESDSDGDDSLQSCKYCGEPFQPRSVRHKYCSNVCRIYAHYVRHGGRKCKVCGQPTPLPSRSVCSEACRSQLPYYRPGCYDEKPTAPSEE